MGNPSPIHMYEADVSTHEPLAWSFDIPSGVKNAKEAMQSKLSTKVSVVTESYESSLPLLRFQF